MKLSYNLALISAVFTAGVNGFTIVKPNHVGTIKASSSAIAVNLPRVELPDAVTEKLEEYDLKNPNEMDEVEYDGYAGAAIGGSLLTFLVPGAILTGIFDDVFSIATAIAINFGVSALLGGGALIYLSLRADELGETIRSNGYNLYQAIKEAGLPTVGRLSIPEVIDEQLEGFGLLSINELEDEDYDGYSGAAVAGTGILFLLSFLLGGVGDIIGDELIPALVSNLILSIIVGGGGAIALSLRKDDLGEAAGGFGIKTLSTIDDVLEGNVLGELTSAVTETPTPTPAAPVVVEDEVEEVEDDRRSGGI